MLWLLVSQCDGVEWWPLSYVGVVSTYGVGSKPVGRLVDVAGAAVVLVWVGFLRSRSRMLMPPAFLTI